MTSRSDLNLSLRHDVALVCSPNANSDLLKTIESDLRKIKFHANLVSEEGKDE